MKISFFTSVLSFFSIGSTAFIFRHAERYSIELYVSKHHASYGVFIDSMSSLKNKKIVNFQNNFDINKIEKAVDNFQSGLDLRKSRNRDLNEVLKTQEPVIPFQEPIRNPKKSSEEIKSIIECLNQSYGMKEREELNSEERVGLIDWSKFDSIAESAFGPLYHEGNFKVKLTNWIKFHRKKGDIVFDTNQFVWK
mmetsp:Transcript_9872/g.13516  ORF Transcript_9872/g.13516 Transcript_9872/m.13516 type:complete len:194 (-) Transcript_9872:27-608(-)